MGIVPVVPSLRLILGLQDFQSNSYQAAHITGFHLITTTIYKRLFLAVLALHL